MPPRKSLAKTPATMATINGRMKIFILHGWTYQTETWQPLVGMLETRGLDVEFLKIPGLTDGMNPTWTLDDYVQWLAQKTARHEKIVLVGHSNGGRISLAFAAKYPEKVAHLILEDSAGIPPRGMRRVKRDVFRKLSGISRTLLPSGNTRKLLYKLIREKDYSNATPEMKKTMADLVSHDLTRILEKIKCPTLIIWGALDKTTPLADGELMHAGIRGSRMVVIPGARHSPHITHALHVADLIENELKHA
jgi:pimeloyl-ACP methyl ester carboxylesterase